MYIITHYMIIKSKININTINYDYLHTLLKNYIQKYNYIGYISLDYRNNIRTEKSNTKMIPFNIYNIIIFKYNITFQQNNKLLANKIRKTVLFMCNNIKNITCIGGESFIYPILLQLTSNFNFYSDSKNLIKESLFNFEINNRNSFKKCNLIDYNKCKNIDCYHNLIINLDRLNQNLLTIINTKKELNKIIIINCCQTDFWKKIKLLSNFKLQKRDRFYISESKYKQKYFITVNLLIKI